MTRRLAFAPLCALIALLAVPAAALATHPPDTNHAHNAFGTPQALPAGDARGPHTTAVATVQGSEPLTVPDDNSGCKTDGTIGAGGVDIGRTLWYSYVAPASGAVTLSAKGSLFDTAPAGGPMEPLDTVIAVYATTTTPTTGNFVRCNDDASTSAPVQFASQVTFNATAGVTYKIQVGSWRGTDDGPGGLAQPTDAGTAPGDIVISSVDPLAQDVRANAVALDFGTTPAGHDNLGAGLDTNASNQPQEDTYCDDADSIPSPIGSTVWYRITVPDTGDVTITTGPFDTVVQLYRQGETTPIACNDDVSGSDFSSRIATRLGAGTYLIQAGGWRGVQSTTLNVRAEFVDRDVDNDGSIQGTDCDDNDGARSPGFGETPGNDVDENCDGVANDRDNDGVHDGDCDDGNAGIRPGATDVPGNGIDEDCAGGDAQQQQPPPADGDGDGVLDADDRCPRENATGADRNRNGCLDVSALVSGTTTLKARPTSSGISIISLVVQTTRGSRVAARCTQRRACPTQSATARGSKVTLRRFRGKRVRAGATLEIRISRPGAHSRVIRYRITRGNFRRSELCIPASGGRLARRCGS